VLFSDLKDMGVEWIQMLGLVFLTAPRWSNGPAFMSEFTFIEEWVKNISQLFSLVRCHLTLSESIIPILEIIKNDIFPIWAVLLMGFCA